MPTPDNVYAVWRDWLAQVKRVSPHTCAGYGRDVQQWLDFLAQKGIPPDQFSKTDYRQYLARLFAAGISAASVARAISAVRNFYRFARRHTIYPQANLALLIAPPYKKPLPRAIASQDIVAMLAEIPQLHTDRPDWIVARDTAILILLYGTGMRISEALALRRGDAPLGDWLRVTGKGGVVRDVPILAVVKQAVDDWLKVSPSQSHSESHPDAPLFIANRGGALHPRAVQRLVVQLRGRLGLDATTTPHALRHGFASHMLAGGGDLRAIQALLGHTSLSTTQRYTHIDQASLASLHRQTHPRSKPTARPSPSTPPSPVAS